MPVTRSDDVHSLMKFGYEYGIILWGTRAEPFFDNQTS